MKGKGQNIHELTRVEAFLLSEKAGHPSHMHDYFWAQAEAIVRQRAAIVDIAVKASAKKKTAGKTVAVAKKKPAAKPLPQPSSEPAPAAPKAKKPVAAKAASPAAKKKGANSK